MVIEAFVPKMPVEAFNIGILGRLARLDECQLHTPVFSSFAGRVRMVCRVMWYGVLMGLRDAPPIPFLQFLAPGHEADQAQTGKHQGIGCGFRNDANYEDLAQAVDSKGSR